MKTLALVCLATLVALGVVVACAGASDDPGAKAHRLAAAGAPIVDVRTPAEFAQGHIRGAVNIPLQELPARHEEIGPHDEPVIVYCGTGRRSAQAAATLRAIGFTAVHDLGPMSAWSGEPASTTSSTPTRR